MCKALPARALIEPLEPRRLLAATPVTPFSPLDLPGAYERPDGSIVVPNSSLAASPDAAAAPATAADDTADYFSTTPAPRGGTAPAVNWSAPAPDARFGGPAASAATVLPYDQITVSVSASYTSYYCGGYRQTSGDTFEQAGCGGFLAFTASTCNTGGTAPASVTVAYTLGGTATPQVAAGQQQGINPPDYTGPLTAKTVDVPRNSTVLQRFYPLRDNLVEGGESVTAAVQPGPDYVVSGGGLDHAGVNLADDPPVVTVSADGADGQAAEPDIDYYGYPIIKNGAYTVVRSGGDPTKALTFAYQMGGSAVAADYSISGPSKFEANETSVRLELQPKTDDLDELSESANLTILDGGTNYKAGSPASGYVVISNVLNYGIRLLGGQTDPVTTQSSTVKTVMTDLTKNGVRDTTTKVTVSLVGAAPGDTVALAAPSGALGGTRQLTITTGPQTNPKQRTIAVIFRVNGKLIKNLTVRVDW